MLYKVFNIPQPSELVLIIQKYFDIYGYYFLFVAAFLEAIFVVGIYFPGSLIIAISVITLAKTPYDLVQIGSIAYIAFLLANILNYLFGKFGYNRFLIFINRNDIIVKMQHTLIKYGWFSFIVTGFFPNFIAINSVCAGIAKLNFPKTLAMLSLSLFLWTTVWTIVGYFIADKVNLQDNNQSYYILLIVFSWGVYLVLNEKFKDK